MIGQTLGHYRIVEQIGADGMGDPGKPPMEGKMRRMVLLGSILVAGLAAAACSDESGTSSPLSPSPVTSGATTIKGTAKVSTTPQSAGQLAAQATGTLEVCVIGTDMCAEVAASRVSET